MYATHVYFPFQDTRSLMVTKRRHLNTTRFIRLHNRDSSLICLGNRVNWLIHLHFNKDMEHQHSHNTHPCILSPQIVCLINMLILVTMCNLWISKLMDYTVCSKMLRYSMLIYNLLSKLQKQLNITQNNHSYLEKNICISSLYAR